MAFLNPDRFFSPDPTIRRLARHLYESVKDLPIISPHGHVDPSIFVRNEPFPDPTELLILPDHYLYRMLRSQGLKMSELGIVQKNGQRQEKDGRKIWQIFADNWHLFAGTPTGFWLSHELYEVFDLSVRLSSATAMAVYDELSEKLRSSEFRPRALFERFNIDVLSTTDAAEDTLPHHRALAESGWTGRIIPTFRPDSVTDLSKPAWRSSLDALSKVAGKPISDYQTFIDVLKERRRYFIERGARATDQGIISPRTHELAAAEAEAIFSRALTGQQTSEDADRFTAHMLMKMAEMSSEDRLVMQIHPGVLRDHNPAVYDLYGPDKGADIPVQTEYTRNLKELLNRFGDNPDMKIIVFTLDEDSYSRELAPLAGHYPAMLLGPAWWFNDSPEGMRRFRQRVTETAGFYNTVGFNDDTRAFPSIPARHDLARRIDSDFLAEKVARHQIALEEAEVLIRMLTRDLPKNAYNL